MPDEFRTQDDMLLRRALIGVHDEARLELSPHRVGAVRAAARRRTVGIVAVAGVAPLVLAATAAAAFSIGGNPTAVSPAGGGGPGTCAPVPGISWLIPQPSGTPTVTTAPQGSSPPAWPSTAPTASGPVTSAPSSPPPNWPTPSPGSTHGPFPTPSPDQPLPSPVEEPCVRATPVPSSPGGSTTHPTPSPVGPATQAPPSPGGGTHPTPTPSGNPAHPTPTPSSPFQSTPNPQGPFPLTPSGAPGQ